MANIVGTHERLRSDAFHNGTGHWIYCSRCICGWVSPLRPTSSAAAIDFDNHARRGGGGV